MKHQRQDSVGWNDWMVGWLVDWWCLVAWVLGELSQQPMWPHCRQRRRCTQADPDCRHSSQPSGVRGGAFPACCR